MDDQESQESLLASHYEQQKADDPVLIVPELQASTGNVSESDSVSLQFSRQTENRVSRPQPSASDEVLIISETPYRDGEPLERVPDVETRVKIRDRGGIAKSKNSVLFRFDDTYLKSVDGVLKLIQIILTLTSLICVVSSGKSEGGYLSLPFSWYLRVFIFSQVVCILTSTLIVFLHTSSLIQVLSNLNWHVLELLIYSVLTIFLLVGSSLVASLVGYFQNPDVQVTQWTVNQLLSAVVLGYGAMCLYAGTTLMGYLQCRRDSQRYTGRYQLQNADMDSQALV